MFKLSSSDIYTVILFTPIQRNQFFKFMTYFIYQNVASYLEKLVQLKAKTKKDLFRALDGLKLRKWITGFFSSFSLFLVLDKIFMCLTSRSPSNHPQQASSK